MIFVTGGTGFLGHHLIPALCRAGYPARVLTRYPEQNAWLRRYPNVEIVRGDLADETSYQDAVQGCQHIIHAAALFRMWGSAESFLAINARGTQNLLAAAERAGVERFLYVSTAAIAGMPAPDAIIDENYPSHPLDAYQRTKLEAEQTILQHHRQGRVSAVVVRPGAFYGPLGDYAFNRLFFRDPMRGIIMQVNGGKYITFPAYVPDVAQGIILALQKGRPGEIYNLSGEWMQHKAVYDIVCREAKLWYPRLRLPWKSGLYAGYIVEALWGVTGREPFWPVNLLRSYVFNNWRVTSEKAQRELGFSPTDFLSGARETIAWYRAGKPAYWRGQDC